MVNEPQKNRPDGLVKNPIVDDGKFEKMKNHESQPETIKKNIKIPWEIMKNHNIKNFNSVKSK